VGCRGSPSVCRSSARPSSLSFLRQAVAPVHAARAGAPSRDSRRRAPSDPVFDVGGTKTPTSNAEPLPIELAAQIRAAHALLVAADEFGHVEGCQEPDVPTSIGRASLGDHRGVPVDLHFALRDVPHDRLHGAWRGIRGRAGRCNGWRAVGHRSGHWSVSSARFSAGSTDVEAIGTCGRRAAVRDGASGGGAVAAASPTEREGDTDVEARADVRARLEHPGAAASARCEDSMR